jgi:hypothetical protein
MIASLPREGKGAARNHSLNRLSDNPENTLLSPSGGGESPTRHSPARRDGGADEGKGVKGGAHPPHP